jgi:hypothetical protein
MSTFRALIAQREARLAIAVWAVVPAVFLFFALTLAVDPTAHLDRIRLGVTVLDAGISTPQGDVAVGPRLIEGLQAQLGAEVIPYPAASAMRDAVLAHDVAAGIVVPAGMTQDLQSGQPVELKLVRIDSNDPFTNALATNLGSQLATSLNAALPALLSGEPPAPALVSVAAENLAPTPDFRFPTVPAALLLPLWMASVAFAALLARAGDVARLAGGPARTGLAELAYAVLGAAITAAVVTVCVSTFTWRWDIDLIGLFGFTWLGLTAIAWLVLGTIRLIGFRLGVLTAVVALFIQQPVSGAAFPTAFAPDAVRWAEPVAPLRYLVEGVRNLLIGGSTTPEMTAALAVLAAAGALLVGGGIARLWLMPADRAAVPAVPHA